MLNVGQVEDREVPVEALIADCAADLIERCGWTKGAMARRANDLAVPPHHYAADRYCAVGAMIAAADALGETEFVWRRINDAFMATRRGFDRGNIIDFNDETKTSRAKVVSALRSASRYIVEHGVPAA